MSETHRIKCGNVNCYIIENGTNGILVDTGKKEFIDKVIDSCKSYNVKLIILTHAHFDHAENAAQISDSLGIPIGMNENDCNLILSNTNQSLAATNILGKIVLSVSLKEFAVRSMPGFKPNVLLHNDDSLSNYGINARIISLPGHTDGSIGIDVDNKHFDALMNYIIQDTGLSQIMQAVCVKKVHDSPPLKRALFSVTSLGWILRHPSRSRSSRPYRNSNMSYGHLSPRFFLLYELIWSIMRLMSDCVYPFRDSPF